jgi:GntR family transcriptional regulator / MocR family aminotransferase
MPKAWATSGPDLLLELRGTKRRAALETALRDAVRNGRLAPGTGLPSSRSLATDLELSRNTVAEAYGQLVAEGWLHATPGSGTRVAPGRGPTSTVAATPAAAPRPQPRSAYDLSPGTPDLAGFPRTAWLAASKQALAVAPSESFGYPDPRGRPELREALTGYLARARGVRTTPDRLVICSGFAQAASLLGTAVRAGGGSALAMEAFGLDIHRQIIEAAGLATSLLPVDDLGARVDRLPDRGLGGVLLTPSHQFPLGVPLSTERRALVLEWARGARRLVIEDDYDGEFRYDRKPVGALQGLAPDHVAYVGTASKSIAPGLGLAWIAVPPRLLDAVVTAKRLSDGYTGVFEQLTLARFIDSGGYDRHVRRSRLRYRRRRDRLIGALAERVPGTQVTGIAAGLHAVVRLRPDQSAAGETAIVSRAARAGLAIAGLSTYTHEPRPEAPAALVIGYGTPPDHAYSGALERLCDILA